MNPITITITAATAEAAAAIRNFATTAGGSLQEVAKHGHAAEGVFMANKMAMMEMEHSARSMADGLAAGMNPLRLLAMEGPRLMQAGTMMTEEFKNKVLSFLPVLGGLGAAFGAGMFVFEHFTEAERQATERAKDMAEAYRAIPDVLKQIRAASEGGLLSDQAREDLMRQMGLGTTQTPDFRAAMMNARPLGPVNTGQAAPPLNLSQMGLPHTENIQAVQEQLVKLGVLIKSVDDQGKAVFAENPNALAFQKLAEMRRKDATDALEGIAKEKEEAKQALDQKLRDLETYFSQVRMQRNYVASLMNSELDPAVKAKQQTELAQLDSVNPDADRARAQAAYQSKLAALTQREQAENERKAAEAARAAAEEINKLRTAAYEEGRKAIEMLEHQITLDEAQQGEMRGNAYQTEYARRFDLLARMFVQGKISEEDYQNKLMEAQEKAAQGYRQQQDELKKIAALKEEIARAETQSQLRAIESNPYLTSDQKSAQSLPLLEAQLRQQQAAAARYLQDADTTKDDAARYEALAKYHEMLNQVSETQEKINQDTMTWSQTMSASIARLHDQLGNFNTQSARIFTEVFQSATNSISENITKLIEGTTTWNQALRSIETTILNSIISAIVKAVVQTTILAAVTRLAAMAGLNVGGGKPDPGNEAAWGAAAMMRSIADLGPIAGPIAFVAELAAGTAAGGGAASYATGGYTGDGGQFDPAGIVHRGEYVFSQPVVNRIGVANLDAMHNGEPIYGGWDGGRPLAASMLANAAAGTGGRAQGNSNISIHAHTDTNKMARAIEQDDAHEKYVVDVMRRNIHKI